MPLDKARVFVSHTIEESAVAEAIESYVMDRFDVPVHTMSGVRPGQQWLKKLRQGVERSTLFLAICSPSSIRSPWVSFEVGAAWVQEKDVIPICHSGLSPDALPDPLGMFNGLESGKPGFVAALHEAICNHLSIRKRPAVKSRLFEPRIRKAIDECARNAGGVQVIESPIERTRRIVEDLDRLLRAGNLSRQTVWTSGFLSAFAIAKAERRSGEPSEYFSLLLKERRLLLELANSGCPINCIISPATPNHIRHDRIPLAIRRTRELLKFLRRQQRARDHICWAVAIVHQERLHHR